MSNSANGHTVQSHFVGKDPIVKKTYEAVLGVLSKCGAVKAEAKKTSIHLVNKTALAGVATRKNFLILTIKSDHSLPGSRVRKSEQVSAHRYHHEINLSSPDEIDAELIGWLKEAYMLSA